MVDTDKVLAQNASARTENSLTKRTHDIALFSRLSEIHFRFWGEAKLGEDDSGIMPVLVQSELSKEKFLSGKGDRAHMSIKKAAQS
jgi:hypothetical protein